MRLDTNLAFSHAITNYSAFEGHVGFTAATGALTAKHVVESAEILFPDEPRCPP